MKDERDTEIAQQHRVMLAEQHIFRFDVAMDVMLIVSILEGISDLFEIGKNSDGRNIAAAGMAAAQCAIGGVIHDQKWSAIFHIEIIDADNVGMAQASDDARLPAKLIQVAAFQARAQDLDGGIGVQVDMHTQINVREAPLGYQMEQPVIAQLPDRAFGHKKLPPDKCSRLSAYRWEVRGGRIHFISSNKGHRYGRDVSCPLLSILYTIRTRLLAPAPIQSLCQGMTSLFSEAERPGWKRRQTGSQRRW